MDYKSIIDNIVWWIPFKKLRNNIRNKINKDIDIHINNLMEEKLNNINNLIEEKLNNVNYNINSLIHINNLEKLNNITESISYRIRKTTPQPYLYVVDFHIAEHCNLNCYSCSNFSQLAEEEYIDIETFYKDVHRLYELTKGLIKEIHIIGGEPLLNKQCEEYFKIVRTFFKTNILQLWTNGILLLKKEDKFWQSCKNNDVEIVITKYPIKLDFNEIEKKANEFDVKIKYTNPDGEKKSWKFILDDKRKNDGFYNFTTCVMANTCVSIKKGKMYTCAFVPNIEHYNKYFNKNLEVTELDYLDIYKINSYKEILEFLSKPIPFCEYCNVEKWKTLESWKSSKKTIEEYSDD